MSFLKLRLLPARKAWKSFTSKLQSKLRKLNNSKPIKKPRNNRPSSSSSSSSALLIDQRIQRNKNSLKPSKKNRRYLFKKKAAATPVYIDRLFKEPITEVAAAGTSKEERSSVADDMWEALGLASPQMNNIDQRAEDFIRRFRAELHRQEIIARRL